jgi:hypothetical protein
MHNLPRNLIIGVPLSLAGLGSCAAWSQGVPESVHLSDPVLYDRHPAWAGEEGGMWCSDPNRPQRLIGINNANEDPSVRDVHHIRNVIRFSDDGGNSWSQSYQTNTAETEMDPACAFGVDGSAFIVTMSNRQGALLWQSADGGRFWGRPISIDYPRMFDRPFLAVDHSNSRFRGRLYVVGAGIGVPKTEAPDEVVVYSSDDGGRTLRGPTTIRLPNTGQYKGVTHMGQPAVLADGTLVVSWTEAYFGHGFNGSNWFCAPDDQVDREDYPCGTSAVKIARSRDGGRTFDAPVIVARGRYDIATDNERLIVGKWYPTLATDSSEGPYHNSLYLAWSDAANGRQRILFSRSTDGGVAWTEPRVVSDDQSFDASRRIDGPHNAMVNVAVTTGGVLGMMYYAQATPSPGATFWPVLTISFDGGQTWSAPQRVTSDPIDIDNFQPSWNVVADAAPEGSGLRRESGVNLRVQVVAAVPTCLYGLTADATGAFRIFAFVNPTGVPEFQSIIARPSGTAIGRHAPNGSVAIRVQGVSRRRGEPVLNLVLAVENVSAMPVRLPIRVELQAGQSNDLGRRRRIDFLNADNGRTAYGAWWDFGAAGSVLAPGARTEARSLQVRSSGTVDGVYRSLGGLPATDLFMRPFLLWPQEVAPNR